MANIIPYFWMPKYVDAEDSSATTLDIYTSNVEKNKEKSKENAKVIYA